MEIQRYEDGVPSWVDMGSADQDRAKEFYSGLFGWNAPEGPPRSRRLHGVRHGRKDRGRVGPEHEPGGTAALVDVRQRDKR